MPLLLVILGLIGLIATAVTVVAFVTAPDGYEDETGYHRLQPSGRRRMAPSGRNKTISTHLALSGD